MADLAEWLDGLSNQDTLFYAKRLSGNDTLANGTHQAGPYIPKHVLFAALPSLHRPEVRNPDVFVDLYVDSHGHSGKVRAIWYNNRVHREGTRNEARLTGFGGGGSPLLDPENTGALTVFAFTSPAGVPVCHVWVCGDQLEEETVESVAGPIEPGNWVTWSRNRTGLVGTATKGDCRLTIAELPSEWLKRFPSGEEIIRRAVELRPHRELDADERLLRRRECEYQVFRSLEEAIELPVVTKGFSSIDDFIERAQTILQRRKARSGRSLELHTRQLFVDAGLAPGVHFDHQPESEQGKRPDFLFPSAARYRDPGFPSDRLRMLAVKTTCKDRWRQILNEADRVGQKHLLTLQEGLSVNQFREMQSAGVRLVVPSPLAESFAEDLRPHLQSVEEFVAEVRGLTT